MSSSQLPYQAQHSAFAQNPPPPPPKPSAHTTPRPISPPPRISSRTAPTTITAPTQSTPRFEEPILPHTLAARTKPQLASLLSSPALLTALLHHPSHTPASLRASRAALAAQLETNAALAQRVAADAAALQARRDSVTAHLLAVRGTEQAWRKKQAEVEGRLEAFGPRVLHARLGASIVDEEGVCKGVEESFLELEGVGEREVQEWVRRVREGRRRVCLRRERKARWDEGRVGGWR